MPDHMLEVNSRQELSRTVPFAFGHGVEAAGEVGELADIVAGDLFVGRRTDRRARPGGAPSRRRGTDKRDRRCRGRAAAWRSGSCRSGSQRDDVAHQPHVLADVLGQAVVGPRASSRRAGRGRLARSSALFLAARIGVDALLDLAHAGEILVELGPVVRADLAAQVGGLARDAVEDALIALCCPGCRTGCRTPARDRPPSAPARSRSARKCASCRPSRNWSRGSR